MQHTRQLANRACARACMPTTLVEMQPCHAYDMLPMLQPESHACALLHAGVANLVPAIGNLSQLQQLVMAYNDLVPDDVAALASAVTNLKLLQHLCVEYNNLAPDGAGETAQADRNLLSSHVEQPMARARCVTCI